LWQGPAPLDRDLAADIAIIGGGYAGLAWLGHRHGADSRNLLSYFRLPTQVLAGRPEARIPAPLRGLAPRLPLPGLRPLYVGAMPGLFGIADALS
jgi:hypothetical protein